MTDVAGGGRTPYLKEKRMEEYREEVSEQRTGRRELVLGCKVNKVIT